MKRRIIPYNPKLKELARKLRNNMTIGEAMVWNILKRKGMQGYDFDRQRPIDQYIVDFYCKDLMLAIEIDGSSHDHEEAKNLDARRQRRLESLGVKFIRIRDEVVRADINSAYHIIYEWIKGFEKENEGKPLPGRIS